MLGRFDMARLFQMRLLEEIEETTRECGASPRQALQEAVDRQDRGRREPDRLIEEQNPTNGPSH